MSEELSVIIRELEGAQDVGVQVGAEVDEVRVQVQAYGVEAGVQTERDLGDIVAMEEKGRRKKMKGTDNLSNRVGVDSWISLS